MSEKGTLINTTAYIANTIGLQQKNPVMSKITKFPTKINAVTCI